MVSEVLVLGGGLAGASAALELARNGIPVHLLEREAAPKNKVCGEFVSIEVQRDLARLGIDLPAMGAVPVNRVRLIARGRTIEAPLPFAAMGISRARLDEAVLKAAEGAGAAVERGVRVTGIVDGNVQTCSGPRTAARIFLATGKHDVRGVKRDAAGGKPTIGFKLHWRVPARQRDEIGSAVELVPFEGGYAGFQRVSESTLNMSLLVRRDRFTDMGASWTRLLADLARVDHIARRLDGAEPLFARPLTIANLPYGYVCNSASPMPADLYRLGDQVGLTAPLTGDGMAIAVRSARIAVASVAAGHGAPAYHERMQRVIGSQVRRAMLLQALAGRHAALPILVALLRLWPGSLSKLASLTRLAHKNGI